MDYFSPHWRVGFLFLVLYPPSSSAASRLPPPVSHTLTHSMCILRGRRGTMCTAKGLDVRPGVPCVSAAFAWQAWDNVSWRVGFLFLVLYPPSSSAASRLPPPVSHSLTHSLTSPHLTSTHSLNVHFAWQAWDNVHCQGVGCTPWRPLGLRLFCVAGVGQCALSHSLNSTQLTSPHLTSPHLTHSMCILRGRRGTMCTAKGLDVRPGVPSVSASFAWQAWDNVHCQGLGCTPWRPLGLRLFGVAGVGLCALPRGWMYALASLRSPPLLRGRRGTMCTVKGLDVRPGVPCVSAAFAWQAWGNVRCQGLGCTPWRPLGLRLFCVAGGGQCALSRARMHALASLGSPPLWRGRRGTMCTAKGSDVRPGVPWVSASFAWHAWDNVHCQGVGCTPWRPLCLRRFCVAGVGQCALSRARMYALASLGSPPLLRGRSGTMCTVKGSDVRPGVPWVSASLAWQARHNVHCQGLGCTPWRPLGLRLFGVAGVAQCALPRARMYALASLGSPPLWRGRRGTMCTAKGSDVRPGVPWVSASFAWQALDNVHCQGLGWMPWASGQPHSRRSWYWLCPIIWYRRTSASCQVRPFILFGEMANHLGWGAPKHTPVITYWYTLVSRRFVSCIVTVHMAIGTSPPCPLTHTRML